MDDEIHYHFVVEKNKGLRDVVAKLFLDSSNFTVPCVNMRAYYRSNYKFIN
jgi:hypothetical protein